MSATPSTWDDVVAAADGLPGVDVSTWYGTPGLKVGGKGFARMRDQDGSLVLLCELAEKEAQLACGDDAFHTTPHYDGYGSILVRLDRVDPEQLRELVRQAWFLRAPARLRKAAASAH